MSSRRAQHSAARMRVRSRGRHRRSSFRRWAAGASAVALVAVGLVTTLETQSAQAAGEEEFRATEIVGGDATAYTISPSGWLYSWGSDTDPDGPGGQDNRGALGNDTELADSARPVLVDHTAWGGHQVQDVASGGGTSYALVDGDVYWWGTNPMGSYATPGFSPVPVALTGGVCTRDITTASVWGGSPVTAIVAGDNAAYALTEAGKVYAWGLDSFGQLGNGDGGNSAVPMPVQFPADTVIAQVVSRGDTAYARATDGTVYAWGSGNSGALARPATDGNSQTPILVSGGWGADTPVDLAAATRTGYVLTTSGAVWAWGADNNGQLGNDDARGTGSAVPVLVVGTGAGGTVVTDIEAGAETGYALASDRTVWAWGSDSIGQIGVGGRTELIPYPDEPDRWMISTADRWVGTPVQVDGSAWASKTITSLGATDTAGYAVAADGSAYSWGGGTLGQLGTGARDAVVGAATPVLIADWAFEDIIQVESGGYYTSYALGADGTIYSWGVNEDGSLGTGGPLYQVFESPTAIDWTPPGEGEQIVSLSAGYQSAVAESNLGNIYHWGAVERTGLVVTQWQTTPQLVDLPTSVDHAVAGFDVWYAWGDDPIAYSWGADTNGALGNDVPLVDSIGTPVPVANPWGNAVISKIAAGTQGGDYQSSAIALVDGRLWGWGFDSWNGQGGILGMASGLVTEGQTTYSPVPVLLFPDPPWGTSPVTDVEVGYLSAFAIVDGTVWAWGHGRWGQLGDGEFNGDLRRTPVEVGLGSAPWVNGADIVEVDPNLIQNVMALAEDGTVYTWGRDDNGLLGNGAATGAVATPIEPDGTAWGDRNIVDISSASVQLALADDGTIYTWGRDVGGSAGDGGADDGGTDNVIDAPSLVDGPWASSTPWIVPTPDVYPANLCGLAWVDVDEDGLIDGTETPLANVPVTLYNTAAPDTVVDTATTDAKGLYSFTGLPAGNYRVQFDTSALSPGAGTAYVYTQPNVPPDDRLDSDVAETGGGLADVTQTLIAGDRKALDAGVIVIDASVELVKTSAEGDGTLDAPLVRDGSTTLPVTVTITNTGEEPVTGFTGFDDVTLEGPDVAGWPCAYSPGNTTNTRWPATGTIDEQLAAARLEPGESFVCTGLMPVLDPMGSHANTSTVMASGTRSGTDYGDDDDFVVTDITSPLVIDKVATVLEVNGLEGTNAGDQIAWQFIATNRGTTPITDLTLVDSLLGANVPAFPVTTLAPGESTTVTTVYTITTDDSGTDVTNVAHVTGRTPGGVLVTSEDDTTTTTVDEQVPEPPAAALEIVKTAQVADINGIPGTNQGDQIIWTFVVTNTGDLQATNVAVADDFPGIGPVTLDKTTLNAGESAFGTVTYTITAADAAAGSVQNVATVTGTGPDGSDIPPETTPPVNTPVGPEVPRGELTFSKVATPLDLDDVAGINEGDLIQYTFVVTNTGELTVSNVTLDDPMFVPPPAFDRTTLEPGQSATARVTYTVTAADGDAGSVQNSATVTGDDPVGDVESPPDTTDTPTIPDDPGQPNAGPALTTVKNATVAERNGIPGTNAGDQIIWTFTVANIGDVPVDGITVTDEFAGIGNVTMTPTSLQPGQVATGTVTYTITAEDAARGSVVNVATANGTGPDGTPIEPAPSDPVTTPVTDDVPPSPLSFSKEAVTADVNGVAGLNNGDTITWIFTITNTGRTTVSDLELIDPMLAGATLTPPLPATLDAGATFTTRVTHVITEAEGEAGTVANVAHVEGTTPDPDNPNAPPIPVESPEDSTETTVDNNGPDGPLTFTKQANVIEANGVDGTNAGDQIIWTFIVTNTGRTVVDNLAITDDFPGVGTLTLDRTTLNPGESAIATSSAYTITAEDAAAGGVQNVATVEGTGPGGTPLDPTPSNPVDTPVDDEVPPEPGPGALIFTKQAVPIETNGLPGLSPGEKITWIFVVTNTGDKTVNGIEAIDDFAGIGTIDLGTDTLAPGASASTTVTYTVTDEDAEVGQVVNVATVTGTDDGDTPIEEPSNEVTTDIVDAPPFPELVFDKEAAVEELNGIEGANEGDRITWTFTVTNEGTGPATDVAVVDPTAGEVTLETTTLEPGQSTTGTATRLLTADDVAAGSVVNTAHATGKGPDGTDVTSNDDTVTTTTVAPPPPAPGLFFTKSAEPVDVNGQAGLNAGDQIVWTFQVTNTGDMTVTDIVLVDEFLGDATPALPTTELAVGESTSIEHVYTITADDEAAGHVYNTATATGKDPEGTPLTSNGSSTDTNVAPRPVPEISVVKGAPLADGDTIVDGMHYRVTATANLPDSEVFFIATNDGEAPLTNITWSDETDEGEEVQWADDACTYDGAALTEDADGILMDGDQPFILPPAEAFTCTGTLPGFPAAQVHADTVTVNAEMVVEDAPEPEPQPLQPLEILPMVAFASPFDAAGPFADIAPMATIVPVTASASYATTGTGVTVDKVVLLNGKAASEGTAPVQVAAGATATVQVTVTNLGSEDVSDLTLTDVADAGPEVTGWSCTGAELGDDGTLTANDAPYVLAAGKALVCTGTLPALAVGAPHSDTVTATGTGVITDTDLTGDDGLKVVGARTGGGGSGGGTGGRYIPTGPLARTGVSLMLALVAFAITSTGVTLLTARRRLVEPATGRHTTAPTGRHFKEE